MGKETIAEVSFGKDLKKYFKKAGSWTMGIMGFGEFYQLCKKTEWLRLMNKLDDWGFLRELLMQNSKKMEWKMREDIKQQPFEMLKKCRFLRGLWKLWRNLEH